MKRILIGTVALMMTLPAFGDDGDKRTTSKPYVDTQIATKQLKIPAANTAGVGAGDSVITYTNVAGGGVIGERALYTGGEYNASTDADKMITASALNNAFTNLPTTDTTTLECANADCTLWTIVDQTAYGINGDGTTTTIDLASLIGNVRGTVYTANNGSGDQIGGFMSNSIISGDPLAFAVDYGDKGMIKGHGRCSTRAGDAHTFDNDTYNSIPSNFTSTLPDASGDYCYCQLEDYTPLSGTMTALSAPWVFDGDMEYCADYCADLCAGFLQDADDVSLAFRAAVFNSVQ